MGGDAIWACRGGEWDELIAVCISKKVATLLVCTPSLVSISGALGFRPVQLTIHGAAELQ